MEQTTLIDGEPISIQVDYLYPVHYAKKSWVAPRDVLFRGRATIEIRSASIDDMPVVYVVNQKKESYGDSVYSGETDREVRFHRNRFVVECGTLSGLLRELREGMPSKTTVFKDLKTERDRWMTKNKYNHPYEAMHEVHDLVSLHAMVDKIRTVRDDGGEAVAQSLAADADELLVAGDTLFREVAEPVVALSDWDAKIVGAHGGLRNQFDGEPSHGTSHVPLGEIAKAGRLPGTNRIKAKVLRPDLAFVDSDDGRVMRSIWKIQDDRAHIMAEMPMEWMAALARLREAMHGRPRHMTPAIVEAIEAIVELPLPTEMEATRLRALIGERRQWGHVSVTSEGVLNAVDTLKREAVILLPEARGLLESGVLRDRSETHESTIGVTEGLHGVGRVRPARSRRDVLRVARMADVAFDELWDALSDESLDLCLVETYYKEPGAGREAQIQGAVAFDRHTGEIVSEYLPERGDPPHRPAMDLLRSHVAGLTRAPAQERGMAP